MPEPAVTVPGDPRSRRDRGEHSDASGRRPERPDPAPAAAPGPREQPGQYGQPEPSTASPARSSPASPGQYGQQPGYGQQQQPRSVRPAVGTRASPASTDSRAYGQQPGYGQQQPGIRPAASTVSSPVQYGQQPGAYGQTASPAATATARAPAEQHPAGAGHHRHRLLVLLLPGLDRLGLIAQGKFREQGRSDTLAKVAWIGGIVVLDPGHHRLRHRRGSARPH